MLKIEFDFIEGAAGGGNNFLKRLKNYYETNLAELEDGSSIVLFNANPGSAKKFFKLLISMILQKFFMGSNFLDLNFIRMDGPISLNRGKGKAWRKVGTYWDIAFNYLLFARYFTLV